MRAHHYYKEEHRDEDAALETPAAVNVETIPENPFTKAAYEWNNALLIAAQKMWGENSAVVERMKQNNGGNGRGH